MPAEHDTKLKPEMGEVGLRINGDKTNVMKTGNPHKSTRTKVTNQPIEQVQEFTYRGSTLSHDGSVGADVNGRTGKASAIVHISSDRRH